MSTLIRKQIYIKRQHDAALKHLASERGLSEAEIIRQAIEEHAAGVVTKRPKPDPLAWQEARKFIMELRALGPTDAPRRRWTREEIYEERLNRYVRRSH